MKRFLVFDPDISGHHLEYIWHLYSYVDSNGFDAVFVVNPLFKEKKCYFQINETKNIKFVYLSNDELSQINIFWSLKSAFCRTKILNKYIKLFTPDCTILITLFSFFPFFPFLSSQSRIRGIVYSVYIRKELSFASKLLNKLFFLLMRCKKNMEIVFLLNDNLASKLMNIRFHTNKFEYLPDPFLCRVSSDSLYAEDVCIDLEIEKRYIHFGSLSLRKGTLVVLDSFLKYNGVEKISLILLGAISEDIKTDFEEKIIRLREKSNIELVVKNYFCAYSLINFMVEKSDYILMPYYNVAQSSGMLGYAAFYNKPVIGPSEGLIGELIKQYSLGYRLDSVSEKSLLNIIEKTVNENNLIIDGERYLKANSPMAFSKKILE